MNFLEHAGSGIYYSRVPKEVLPAEVSIGNVRYQRFMDFIYIPGNSYELTDAQVRVVARLRDQYNREVSIEGSNRAVRQVFKKVVLALNARAVLEVGPGLAPLFPDRKTFLTYNLLDIRKDAVAILQERGLACHFFTSERPLPRALVAHDVALALFVLHFPFHQWQAAAIERALSLDGIFVANVYRRGPSARKELRATFTGVGLQVSEVLAHTRLCREHRYWVMSKRSGSVAVEQAKRVILHECTDV